MRLLATLSLLAVIGCSPDNSENIDVSIPADAMTVLQKGTKFELLSLEPNESTEREAEGFHGYIELGSTFPNQAERERLTESLSASVSEHNGSVDACFIPRHGIRVRYGGKRHDFVICFQCSEIRWYIDDIGNQSILTSSSAQPVFDQVLSDASVALAKKD